MLIAGGSIGGLTTAVLLRDLGCDVEVYERAESDLEDRGAGIVVLPVTERYFEEGGGGGERVSLELTYWKYVDGDGNVISSDPDRFRFSGWSTIYRALLAVFSRDCYHFGHEVTGFEEDDSGIRIEFAGGGSEFGDMLVFADGMASTGRSILLPRVRPEYAGYVAWRGTVPEARLSPGTQAELADSMIYQILDDGHILVYAIPDSEGHTAPPHRIINWVWYRNYETGGPYEDLMTDVEGRRRAATMPPGSIRDVHMEEMRAQASMVLAPQMADVVLQCHQPLIQAVFDVESPRMVFGRTCLLGDAAFTLRPHVAAGQAKACADAWALRDALRDATGDVHDALARWEPPQLELGRSALARTREMGDASQVSGSMVPGDPKWKFGLSGHELEPGK